MNKINKLNLLIILVSIMAIIITAKQIYNIVNHDIVQDNDINNIETDESNEDDVYQDLQKISFNFPNVYNEGTVNTDNAESDFIENNQEVYDVHLVAQRYYPYSSVYSIGFYMQFSYDVSFSEEYPLPTLNILSSHIYSAGKQYMDRSVKWGGDDLLLSIFNPKTSGEYVIQFVSSKEEFESMEYNDNPYGKIGIQHLGNNKFTFYFRTVFFVMPTEDTQETEKYWFNEDSLSLHFREKPLETTTIKIGDNSLKTLSLESNELFYNKNLYNGNSYREFIRYIIYNWEKGKETATLQCSIGEYYDEDGNLAISTQNNDLPMLFNIRDEVIPYIPVAGGGTEPMSKQRDGSPKKFQVTQVRPYFDGAFWQEIQLQELTTKNKIQTVNFTSGSSGNILGGYPAPDQTITVTEGKIVNVLLSWTTGALNLARPDPTVTINSDNNSFTISGVYLIFPNVTVSITAEIIYEV